MNIKDNEFGDYLKLCREKTKTSLNQFSLKTGISLSYLHQLEKGIKKNISINKLNKLIDVLELDENEIQELYILATYSNSQKNKSEESEYSFGNFLKTLRKKADIKKSSFASNLEVSRMYLDDLENGNRNAPENNKIEKIALLLKLNEDDTNMLYNLGAETHKSVPADINDSIQSMTREQRFEFYNGLREMFKK